MNIFGYEEIVDIFGGGSLHNCTILGVISICFIGFFLKVNV